jgi:N-sulfoglucosamine sulfohydrolase
MRRPNILYMHSHDTGRYVQPYGHDVPTPNIQRLAEQGVLFRQAFAAAPTCSPSRAALLTGQAAHSSGMLGLAHRGFALNDYTQHIVHALREGGYRSTLIGVQHVAANASRIGYDDVIPLKNHRAGQVAPAAVNFLDGSPQQPFFLSVGFEETHREFADPSPAEDPRYLSSPSPLPDTPETRRDMAGFRASARILDQGIGAVLDALESTKLADTTLVICTTDHGLPFPRMKCTLTDDGIGVMLIMRGPGGFSGGQVCDAMVSHIDVFPTLCELLGLPQPNWLQGRSLLPLIRGWSKEINREIFAEVTYHAAYEPQRSVRTRRWKYIRRFDERSRPVLPNCDDSLSKNVWLQHGWRDHSPAPEELYDLVFDPNERRNLAREPEWENIKGELRERLEQWMRSTDDPLMTGPVAAPPGAQLNDPDGLSPSEPVTVVGSETNHFD